MECPTENDLVAFVGRALGADRAYAIEEHLAECRRCRATVAVCADPPSSEVLSMAATSLAPVMAAPGDRASLASRLSHAQAMTRIGTTLAGKWTVESFIGAGGMAHVFAGRHRNGRRVAIKLLRPELAVLPELVRRFLREGYVANQVAHPGAVAVLDDDTADGGAPFLVMELLEGETLKARIDREGPMPLEDVLRLADALLAVLEAAHARGVVHRDIKPENLFITKSGELKVLDFGIARVREATNESEGDTREGQMLGTPSYMAPEQARGETSAVDARTDVWASAATIFAMLAGKPLRSGKNTADTLRMAMNEKIASTRALSEHVPPGIALVLDRALAFAARERFENAASFRKALAEATSAPASQRTSLLAKVVAALAFVSTAAVIGWSIRSQGENAAIPVPSGAADQAPPQLASGATAPSAPEPEPSHAPAARIDAGAFPAPKATTRSRHTSGPPAASAANATSSPAASTSARAPEEDRDPLGPRR